MQNKNKTLERKFIILIIFNNLKCIILADGFYSVTLMIWLTNASFN
jgi:hypothetical protein